MDLFKVFERKLTQIDNAIILDQSTILCLSLFLMLGGVFQSLMLLVQSVSRAEEEVIVYLWFW